MLLGSGELGKEVAIELQRLGCEVIAVDRYADAPGHAGRPPQPRDRHDRRARRCAPWSRRERPHLIVPEIEAIATDELARIEADGLATVIPTARAAQLTMNREGIRRLAAEELGPADQRLRLRLAPRPSWRPRRRGDRLPLLREAGDELVRQGPDLRRERRPASPRPGATPWRAAASSRPRVIVEGCVDFDFEITQLTVRACATARIVTSFCEPIGHRQVKGDYVESWQPQADEPRRAGARSRDIAGRGHRRARRPAASSASSCS